MSEFSPENAPLPDDSPPLLCNNQAGQALALDSESQAT